MEPVEPVTFFFSLLPSCLRVISRLTLPNSSKIGAFDGYVYMCVINIYIYILSRP